MRLDLTAAEHTNCPRLLRRFGLLAVVLVLRGAELESGRADAREPADPDLNWTLPGHATVSLIWH
jgi:hypothetical protein